MSKRLTDAQVRSKLATACGKAGGVNAFARLHGLTGAYVSMARTGKRTIGPKILAALGLVQHVTIRATDAKRATP